MSKPAPFRSIQYLRALAALAVAAFHTAWTHTELGAAGVDVFFVISGFIMVHVSKHDTTPRTFLIARAKRLVPLYWLITLAAVPFLRTRDTSHIVMSFLFVPYDGPDGHGWPVLSQGWTLNYEVFFYVVFAATLLVRPRLRLAALTVILFILCAAGVALQPTQVAVAVYTSPLLIEFVAGAWLCQAWRAGWLRPGQASWMLIAGLAGLLAQITLPTPEAYRALIWGIPALLIVAGLLGVESAGRLPRLPGLLAIGNASYALYLTHELVMPWLRPVFASLPAPIALLPVVAACTIIGLLVHHLLERPIASLLSRSTRAHLQRSLI